jgi:hypothetical protein
LIQKKHLKWIAVVGLLAILIVGVFNPFEIVYGLDQSNEATSTGYFLMDSETQDTYPIVAQGFKMSVIAGNINRISFRAMRWSAVTGTIKVQIWRDNYVAPTGPDVLLYSTEIYPALIIGTTWVNVFLNFTYGNFGATFLVLDFTDTIFAGGSYIRIYHSGNSYHVTDDFGNMWSGTWQRNTNNVWSYDATKDLLFRVYRGLIRCWKCDGTNAVSEDFPWGTICGQGGVVDYPYTTVPPCSGGSNNPPICSEVTGDSSEGLIGTTYSFIVHGSDPDGDAIQYKIDWGDDTPVPPYQASYLFSHSWSAEGYYVIQGRVQDEHGAESTWCAPFTMFISEEQINNPPVCNDITGPSSGSVGNSYQFMIDASDPDSDPLQYYFDWGDMTNSGWIDTDVSNKSWSSQGTYSVKAKVRDDSWFESEYCSPVTISITNTGDVFSIIFVLKDRASGLALSDATIVFNSETKISGSDGNLVFGGIPRGSLTATATKDGYKPLSGTIVVDESKTIYALLAPVSESYESVFSDSPSPPPPFDMSLYVLIAMIIIGVVATVAVAFKAPGISAKIGLSVIIWIITAIIYLLMYGGVI